MKRNIKNVLITLWFPIAARTLAGCWTPPQILNQPDGAPSLVGGMTFEETATTTATVQSIDADQRQLVLLRNDGSSVTYKAGPQVINFDQIKTGDKVKATVADAIAIFLVKNGPLPSAGQGVVVGRAAKGAMPGGVVLTTQDFSARVIRVDPSYRLLTLEFTDGKIKTFKIPLPFTLQNVRKGDDIVVRSTQTLAVHVEKQ